ncbi:MAG TPA: hypothetical protein VK283_03475 [Acidimicrobiales bacterium]|nr:hypothetical protein [Acidimicrobiales bacterium]
MSSLWTPEGEHRIKPAGDDPTTPDPSAAARRGGGGEARSEQIGPEDLDELGPEEQAELASRLDELRHQLLSAPAEVVVANHVYGLFELAAIHLSQRPPGLAPARLAVDAMAALVEGLQGRLGEAERSLQDALAQIRLAFVQISGSATTADGEGGSGPS